MESGEKGKPCPPGKSVHRIRADNSVSLHKWNPRKANMERKQAYLRSDRGVACILSHLEEQLATAKGMWLSLTQSLLRGQQKIKLSDRWSLLIGFKSENIGKLIRWIFRRATHNLKQIKLTERGKKLKKRSSQS